MKQEPRMPYELRLDDMIHCREVENDDVVKQEGHSVVLDEKAENEKIATLQQKIKEEEAKPNPDRLCISRWQYEIVSIRQNFLETMFKPIKVKGRQ